MALSPQQKTRLLKGAGRGLARYLRFVRRRSDVIIDPADARQRAQACHPFIFAMWHGQFLMLPTLHEGAFPVSAMVARHRDADVVGDLLGEFHMQVVRGAGAAGRKRNRGGAVALRTALRVLEEGATFAMTADVPPGPARRCGAGIITLAKHSGRPILPFATATSRYLALPTWSRMTINLPFSKLAYVVGEPIWVPPNSSDEDLERYRRTVEAELNRVTARAYALAGANMARATPALPGDPSAPPKLGLRLKVYRAGTSLLRLAAPAILAMRMRQGKEDPARLSERYGKASVPRPAGPLIWIHAASVGETNAILPLIERMTSTQPELGFVLTTGTMTSASLCARRLGSRAIHQYVPLDAPEYVSRFLDHWRPDLAVFTESEIWPNLIIGASERKIPLALVNARVSSRSLVRWRRNKAVARQLFSRFSVVLAQNEGLARAFTELGAGKSLSVGNLKIDAPPLPVDTAELDRLRRALAGRPTIVAASTHEGEEIVIADAHRLLARAVPSVLTIIAPRHPERGTGIAEMLKQRGLSVAQRSSGALPDARTDVYVADTIGELGTLYALTDVAFVGGSLVPHGGQNPIEPISHGAAVLTGPEWRNFRDFYLALLRHKGAREVASAEQLAAAASALLTDESELASMREGARTALLSLSGALDRTAEILAALLPSSVPSSEAEAPRAS